jgi:hypothetical protein
MTLIAYYTEIYGAVVAQILVDPALDSLDRSIIKLLPTEKQLAAAKIVLARAKGIREG